MTPTSPVFIDNPQPQQLFDCKEQVAAAVPVQGCLHYKSSFILLSPTVRGSDADELSQTLSIL